MTQDEFRSLCRTWCKNILDPTYYSGYGPGVDWDGEALIKVYEGIKKDIGPDQAADFVELMGTLAHMCPTNICYHILKWVDHDFDHTRFPTRDQRINMDRVESGPIRKLIGVASIEMTMNADQTFDQMKSRTILKTLQNHHDPSIKIEHGSLFHPFL